MSCKCPLTPNQSPRASNKEESTQTSQMAHSRKSLASAAHLPNQQDADTNYCYKAKRIDTSQPHTTRRSTKNVTCPTPCNPPLLARPFSMTSPSPPQPYTKSKLTSAGAPQPPIPIPTATTTTPTQPSNLPARLISSARHPQGRSPTIRSPAAEARKRRRAKIPGGGWATAGTVRLARHGILDELVEGESGTLLHWETCVLGMRRRSETGWEHVREEDRRGRRMVG